MKKNLVFTDDVGNVQPGKSFNLEKKSYNKKIL
jgi:hypothetical protein